MKLPDLQRLAQSLGLAGTARMRKGQLIAAIEERRAGARRASTRVRVRRQDPDRRPSPYQGPGSAAEPE